MSSIIVDMSLSLDGFVAGPNDAAGHAFGDRDAERLHGWMTDGTEVVEGSTFLKPAHPESRKLIEQMVRTTGALLSGRRLYDLVNGWDGSHPIPGLPVVVLTHKPPASVPKGKSSFTFCSNLTEAVAAARRLAGGKDVMAHGGEVTQQLLAAKLADELRLHIAPILLGDGRPLFGTSATDHQLELVKGVATPQATHLHYRVRYRR